MYVFNNFSIQNLANVTGAAESSRNVGSCVAACKCRPLSRSRGAGVAWDRGHVMKGLALLVHQRKNGGASFQVSLKYRSVIMVMG